MADCEEMSDDDDGMSPSLFLLDTALENGMSFTDCWRRYGTVEYFLRRDEYISVRGTVVKSDVDLEELEFHSDIDGVTIAWHSISRGLHSLFRHVELTPREAGSLRPLFPVLKKHLKLTLFSEISMRVLKEAVGTQLIYDGQWETWLGFVPDHRESVPYNNDWQIKHVLTFMERLRINFVIELRKLLQNGQAIHTLAKNNINNPKRIFVLPGDQGPILESLETALDATELGELGKFQKMLFTFRFGDKWRGQVPLPIADVSAVQEMCVHVGHVISSNTQDLFWSRQGIREVAGDRSRVISAFSFAECANFLTPLDGGNIDISQVLRNVCHEEIRFVQMYSDMPHCYPKSRVHPVSASVLMVDDLQPERSERSVCADAENYLSVIGSNFSQCIAGVCRLEFVVSLGHISKVIDAANLIRQDNLEHLLATHPMLVPFPKCFQILDKIRTVAFHLHSKLCETYNERKGTGDTIAVWKAFQLELAVEKLLWGHPMSGLSRIYSTNLGPGLEYPSRSLTDQMGFLCLDDSNACCADDSTLPPLCLYSKNLTVQRRIENASGLFNAVGGSEMILGQKILMTLLKDFYSIGHVFLRMEHFTLMLKTSGGNASKRVVGGLTIADLVKKLIEVKKAKWPMVFVVVRKLLERLHVNVEEVMSKGIRSLQLSYFPAFRSYDESHHQGMYWDYKFGFWVIVDISDNQMNVEMEAEKMHALIVSVMERMKLCHSSYYRDCVFPWIKPVMEKLSERHLRLEDSVRVLVFVSCLALIQLGRYVDYNRLNFIERRLPVKQSMLQVLEVQSKFLLPSLNTTKIFRLHQSIPVRLDMKRHEVQGKETKETRPETAEFTNDQLVDRPERIGEYEGNEPNLAEEVVIRHQPSHKCYATWTPAELSFLDESELANPRWTLFQKWRYYQERCRESDLPDRSFQAFKRKLIRKTKAKN